MYRSLLAPLLILLLAPPLADASPIGIDYFVGFDLGNPTDGVKEGHFTPGALFDRSPHPLPNDIGPGNDLEVSEDLVPLGPGIEEIHFWILNPLAGPLFNTIAAGDEVALVIGGLYWADMPDTEPLSFDVTEFNVTFPASPAVEVIPFDGGLVGLGTIAEPFAIEAAFDAAAFVGASDFHVTVVAEHAVPEVGVGALLGLGIAVLGAGRRRRG